jgi:hypothetical protein
MIPKSIFTREAIAKFCRAMILVVVYMWKHRTLNPTISPSVLAKRLTACQVGSTGNGCDKYLRDSQQCGVCKCFILAKARLVTEDCPHPDKNHWT